MEADRQHGVLGGGDRGDVVGQLVAVLPDVAGRGPEGLVLDPVALGGVGEPPAARPEPDTERTVGRRPRWLVRPRAPVVSRRLTRNP